MNEKPFIPMIDLSKTPNPIHAINEAFSCLEPSGNDRNRPYNGQPWTDEGIRGQQEVKGLTMRDISDCVYKAFLSASGIHELYHSVEDGTWKHSDVYKLQCDFDPGAVANSVTCHIEKMMGIFPNIKGCPSFQDVMDQINDSDPDNSMPEPSEEDFLP